MANLSLRSVDRATALRLKAEARRQNISVNQLILRLIRVGMQHGTGARRARVYRDLDHLAGTWSSADARAFARASLDFRKIDEALWR